ncbi:hypothetical protein [Streptosporangium pseudovulgare]|uniref:Ig-like domain-containing protein n=1 Tax=Streptosporangium pseudovulgare TaxID=35765 RepID=A0ABQ2RE80_9ACTN|nr:hypothetical protein [Streptosporangium pseudovulgare]GGQ22198.1 hypothetical protein GCM10010140_60560 [Streptosporangium pseudovulgare]
MNRCAEHLFKTASPELDLHGEDRPLHQFRHSALQHFAEADCTAPERRPSAATSTWPDLAATSVWAKRHPPASPSTPALSPDVALRDLLLVNHRRPQPGLLDVRWMFVGTAEVPIADARSGGPRQTQEYSLSVTAGSSTVLGLAVGPANWASAAPIGGVELSSQEERFWNCRVDNARGSATADQAASFVQFLAGPSDASP